jgi:hypothetical protein
MQQHHYWRPGRTRLAIEQLDAVDVHGAMMNGPCFWVRGGGGRHGRHQRERGEYSGKTNHE